MQKGTGFVIPFEVFDMSGYPVTGSHAVTAIISKDGGAFAATTTVPVTASATVPSWVFLTLTDAEATADLIVAKAGSPDCYIAGVVYNPEAIYTAVKATYLDAPITTRATSGVVADIKTQTNNITNLATSGVVASIKTQTDTIPNMATSGVLASVKTQTDNISNLATSGVVASIKTQTDKIPTLAVSGTALSINDWSITRATKLDNLDATITSRAAATGMASAITKADQLLVDTTALTGKVDVTLSSRAAATGIVAVSGMAAILSNTTAINSNVDVPVSTRATSAVQASGQVVLDKFTFTGTDVNAAATVDTSNVASASGLSQAISSLNSVAASATSAQEVLDQFVFSTPGKVDATAGALAPEDIVSISSSVTGALSVAGVTLADNAIDASSIATDAVAKIQAGLALSGTALSNATWTDEKATQLDASISSRAAASGIVAVSGMAAVLSNTTAINSNVDVPISTRAASSVLANVNTQTDKIPLLAVSGTALSNVEWTPTRAIRLDSLDAAVSSRAAASGIVAVSGIAQVLANTTAINANVDVPVSSRAASATALDKTVWTDIRAGLLDLIASRAPSATALDKTVWVDNLATLISTNIDTTISSRMAAGAEVEVAVSGISSGAFTDDAVARIQSGLAASTTALSNETWTNTLADNLTLLDASVSSRATSAIQEEDHAVIDQFVFTTPGKVDAVATVDVDEAAIAAAITASMGGSGSVEWVHTVTNSTGLPQGNAWVAYYTDEARTILAVQGYTDTQGEVTFKLNAGTYYTKTVVPGFDVKKEEVPVA